ncbi:hypothetical protein V6N11_074214 [Hibiscus sabdariffa]|uniref:Uncharacterized protein n=1 Tax=Hibiscus sabdariffa TaxID=183260 RepID=A0ABR2NJJ3_9ROSI
MWFFHKDIAAPESFQQGIAARLHQFELDHKRNGDYYVFRRGVSASAKPLFSWADHPSLVTDAVENGWSRFGFTPYMSSPSTRSNLLGLRSPGDHGRANEMEVNWEVSQGSADFMQKIRLKSRSKKGTRTTTHHHSMAASSVIRTALPLPGPPLGNSAFPQEAYFEIKILYCHGKLKEGEKTRLIHENSESLAHDINQVQELKSATEDDGKGEAVMLSVGLTAAGPLPLNLPGTYPGSISFNSNGSVYLDGDELMIYSIPGIELVFGSEKEDWGKAEKVIGCGFDPEHKKVFFTLDSELVHEINCKSEEFGTPLYPTLAANQDVLVLANFGQSAFAYGPANGHRTPNPCFIGPLVNSPAALGYEDSKELFSMGRIDSQWLNRSTTKGIHRSTMEFDEESEDLFEIALDNNGRSPNSVL